MGFGDVKLAAVIGAFLGWERLLVALVIAVFAGAVLGVVGLALRRENRVKFGPYLALGAVVALIWGDSIVAGYRQLLGM
jgi:leader peptidase (prepilin peptidase)/N-methyltransferase